MRGAHASQVPGRQGGPAPVPCTGGGSRRPALCQQGATGPGPGHNRPMSTVFTKIMNGELPGHLVWADEVCVVLATIEPHTDGHVLVVPRAEIGSYVDAPEDVVAHLAVVARRVGAAQTRVFGAPRAGVMVVGYGVDHLHVHVLPIWSEADVCPSSARHDVPDQEIGAAMERLRAGLTEDGWGEFVTR